MNSPRDIVNNLGYYSATVHGYSMYPLLFDHRDSVYILKINEYTKYDVALFERADGQLVLHRVIKIKDSVYYPLWCFSPFTKNILRQFMAFYGLRR